MMNADDKIPLVEVFAGSPWECELVKGLLESADIQAALKNDNMVNYTPSMSVCFGSGGMKVIVSADDYDVASEIVATREQL
jgi:hypothetical protein